MKNENCHSGHVTPKFFCFWENSGLSVKKDIIEIFKEVRKISGKLST